MKGLVFFKPTTRPTKPDVLYDFRELWQSPRSRILVGRIWQQIGRSRRNDYPSIHQLLVHRFHHPLSTLRQPPACTHWPWYRPLRAAGELGCPSPPPCLAPALPSFCVETWKFRFGNPTAPIRSHAALALRKCATPIPAVPLGASATKRPTANKLSLRLKITSSNYTAYCSGTAARVRIRSIAASTRRWTTTARLSDPTAKA